MELKVWVEGIQRIVCGVNETTTCQDVVFALAHATGKVGRFTLVERWRNNERLLAPHEYPLKILMKWGEYSNDIQFILRQSDPTNNKTALPNNNNNNNIKTTANVGNNSSQTSTVEGSGGGGAGSPAREGSAPVYSGGGSPAGNPVGVVKGVPQARPSASDLEPPPLKDVPPYREPPPPYRSPPPPTAHRKSPGAAPARAAAAPADRPSSPEAVSYNSQYRELVSLVNYQRERLSNQQADLIKFDAEIGYWESKGREQDRQVEILQQQISSADNQLRISSEQVQALTYIEEESEGVKQQELCLRSELGALRGKLAECEAELQQCRAKIRRLLDDLQACGRHHDNRGAMERSMLAEMESLQSQIQHAKHATDLNHLTAETLKREVGMLESAIMEKKRQVEQLVQEMKEANLQSLAGSTDELRHLLDGSCKAGSARRIIGSPRQLENAAPTNKNPHGVWV